MIECSKIVYVVLGYGNYLGGLGLCKFVVFFVWCLVGMVLGGSCICDYGDFVVVFGKVCVMVSEL